MSFDRLAPYYRWMEFLLAGSTMHRCRTACLDEIPKPHNILLLGEGHGRSLIECVRRFPEARITCVDASGEMLAVARQQLDRQAPYANNVKFIHADILVWSPPPETYDLVITHFFFDCFRAEELAVLVHKLAASMVPGASLLVADFQNAPAGLRRWRSRTILWLLYTFFRATTGLTAHELVCPDALLEQAGLTLRRRVQTDWGLFHSDWWQQGTVKNGPG